MRLFGKRVAHRALGKHTKPGGFLDVRYGFSLLRSRGVGVGYKLGALAVGVMLTGVLLAFEVPFEGLLGLFVPFLGFAGDVMVDGAEAIMMPVIFACLVLPHLTRAGSSEGFIVRQ